MDSLSTVRKKLVMWSLGVTALSITILVLTNAFPEYRQHTSGDQLTIYRNPWGNMLVAIGIVAWLSCLIAAFVSFMHRSWIGIVPMLWATSLCLSPFVLPGKLTDDDFGILDFVDSVKDEKGTEYHFLSESGIQGMKYEIAEVTSKNGREVRYKVLTVTGGEGEELCLVKSKGVTESRRLFISKEQVLVGVPVSNHAFIGYDLRAHRDCTMHELSNFILILPNDDPSEKDFQDLLQCKGQAKPNIDTIRKALKNPNGRVRTMAARYLQKATR